MAQGPEDSAQYTHDRLQERVDVRPCVKCGEIITLAHCNDGKCPWCRDCWNKVKP